MDYTTSNTAERVAADQAVLAAEQAAVPPIQPMRMGIANRTMPGSRLSAVTQESDASGSPESTSGWSAGPTAIAGLAVVAGAVVVSTLVNSSREDLASDQEEQRSARDRARALAMVSAAVAIPLTAVAISASEPGSTRLHQHDAVMLSKH